MDYKAPEAVEQCDDDSSQWALSGQCDDDSSQWELRLSQLQLMELSAAQLEADGGQCPAAILN
jgi:hypothetical protein